MSALEETHAVLLGALSRLNILGQASPDEILKGIYDVNVAMAESQLETSAAMIRTLKFLENCVSRWSSEE